MEENQFQTEAETYSLEAEGPTYVDNSEAISEEDAQNFEEVELEGESFEAKDPSEELILGKFKSVEDLKKAYQELQRHQGNSSEELGFLRKEMANLNDFREMLNFYNKKHNEYAEIIQRDKAKYSSEGYFQDPAFKELYKEALGVLGANLDTEKMVSLLEAYVKTRIQGEEKKKVAQKETQNVLDSMTYEKNPKTTFTPPKKAFDEMTEKEIDEMLERLI